MRELIITEKPSAAKNIAHALGKKPEVKSSNGVKFYNVTRNGKLITVVPAVGHLFTVGEEKKSFKYPVFDIGWKPVYEENKDAFYAKKYATVIMQEAKSCTSFVVACDYDIEGEVIGLNVIRFLCKQKDAKRMKFSTLTTPDLIEAYDNMSKTIDWGQAKAGETRHFLDWMYGINLSRALTLAIRKSKVYKTMSSGRVQGPALHILGELENEIKSFVPKKFWQLSITAQAKNGQFEAWHHQDKFWEENKVQHILNKIKGKPGKISEVKTDKKKQPPPSPFDLINLQTESYAHFSLKPKYTLDIAQDLYSKGYISYPRTSSQQLPDKLNYRKIITELMRQNRYSKHGELLLKNKVLKPNNGKKSDPAHPAIYPTGIIPKALQPDRQKVYDLIVKRFFATFGEWAVRGSTHIKVDVDNELFVAKGSFTIEKGWHVLYEPYVKQKEETLPEVANGETVKILHVNKHDKETQPPKRYTEASLITELEKRNLGTKATRAQIIENLYDREYITGKSIETTKLGLQTVETLRKYVPEILDEELTRYFEEEMEKIRNNSSDSKKILSKARMELTKVLENIKKHEKSIGMHLSEAYRETEKEKSYVGICPKCKTGELHIIHSRKNNSRFIACNKYPDCKATFSIPGKGLTKRLDEVCQHCNYPMIMIFSGKIPKKLCINPECKGKKLVSPELRREESEMIRHIVEQECPKCKEGKLVVRHSIYGHFLACDKFPKCRYTQNIKDGPVKEDFK